MMQRLVFLKPGPLTFSIHLFHGFSFLRSEIVLLFAKVCYTFEENNFLPPWFYEKSHPKFFKKELVCIFDIYRFVGLGQEWGCRYEGRGNYMKILKKGGIEEKGGETKSLKLEEKLDQRMGVLKMDSL